MDVQYLNIYIDKDKLKADVKRILKRDHIRYVDLGLSIGYSHQSIRTFFGSKGDSRFIAAALIERFKLNPNDYTKERLRMAEKVEPVQTYMAFTNRHEDLKELYEVRRLIENVKGDFEDELERYKDGDKHIDADDRERYEFAVDSLKLAWEKVSKVDKQLRIIHSREEQENGRAEE